ncbi:hypothetical protein EMH_0011190 [Eimeria mitis]|uniref:Uncharacterized protein n=1 Tax=Eimeria mitis TaxID=44415 RepID=U6K770_9EIME|nr:hypothetical protein EMH_0011190 [Eimeria mitis]
MHEKGRHSLQQGDIPCYVLATVHLYSVSFTKCERKVSDAFHIYKYWARATADECYECKMLRILERELEDSETAGMEAVDTSASPGRRLAGVHCERLQISGDE